MTTETPQPIAQQALRILESRGPRAMTDYLRDKQASPPYNAPEGLAGVMRDHSLVVPGAHRLTFHWFQDGRWETRSLPCPNAPAVLPPALPLDAPMFGWPTLGSVLTRAIVRLTDHTGPDMQFDGLIANYQETPDPDDPLVTPAQLLEAVPQMTAIALKALRENHPGDALLSLLDQSESEAADDVEDELLPGTPAHDAVQRLIRAAIMQAYGPADAQADRATAD